MGVTMRMSKRLLCAVVALAAVAAPAIAQVKRAGEVVNSPAVVALTLPNGTYITPGALVQIDQRGDIVVQREAFQLVNANTSSAPVTIYGGDYILSQLCGSYGTLRLEVRGADGLTWLPLVTKTASDSGSGTGVALGSYAVVRVSVSGTAGCYASLSRVPA